MESSHHQADLTAEPDFEEKDSNDPGSFSRLSHDLPIRGESLGTAKQSAMKNAVEVEGLTHLYPPGRGEKEARTALRDLTLDVRKGEIFGLLGPNGSGKSTLFKILSTILTPTQGKAKIFGFDVRSQFDQIRRLIGVVFQHPSLDKKLTARENLLHQGHLYNLRGGSLKIRISEMLSKVGISDRANDLVEHLSGGMQRRVELAKALLHQPQLLILDEPSTGLDPGARREFMNYLDELRKNDEVTIVLTSHILDEAEKCDRIAILDGGVFVALGKPHDLEMEIGGDVISVTAQDTATLSKLIAAKFETTPIVIDNTLHIERSNGHEFIPQLVQSFPGMIDSVKLSKPTLEDVFIHKTGHKFWEK